MQKKESRVERSKILYRISAKHALQKGELDGFVESSLGDLSQKQRKVIAKAKRLQMPCHIWALQMTKSHPR